MLSFLTKSAVLVEVCARCEARARMAGELDDSLKTVIARGLRRRAAPRVKLKSAPCLYRCPLRGVTVKVGGDPRDPSIGASRVIVPRRDADVVVDWVAAEATACETAARETAARETAARESGRDQVISDDVDPSQGPLRSSSS